MINGHGDDSYLFATKIVADFSSNVNYNGVSVELKHHLTESLHKINNYPEADAQSLQKEIAQWHQLKADEVLVTNGATEAFYLVAHAFRNQSATIIVPAFAEYEDACVANDIHIVYQEWDALDSNSLFTSSLVFFGNPNNPTGAVFSEKNISNWLQKHPKTTFVIDEAYVDFTSKAISVVSYVNQFPNLIIIKSLTKTYSIPGLRLGYVLSNTNSIKKILAFKMPWSVNTLALEAGLFIIKNKEYLNFSIESVLKDTETLRFQLNEVENISVQNTNTNFFLCKTHKGTAAQLKQFLLADYGLLLRDASNFKSLTPQHFRIATQTKENNDLLVKGITAWMKSI